MTEKEAAQRLGIDVATLKRHRQAGDIEYSLNAKMEIEYSEEQLLRFQKRVSE